MVNKVTLDSIKKAKEWFQKAVQVIKDGGKGLPSQQRPLIAGLTALYPTHTGRMIMFYYDPKLKDTLPYYDRFPLVIPIRFQKDRFLGLNLHYLPINMRKNLLDALKVQYKNKHLTERKRLQLDYQILIGSSRFKWFKPCIKWYLHSHVRSKYNLVDPREWDMVITLPLERFEKATKTKVWADSRRKLNAT